MKCSLITTHEIDPAECTGESYALAGVSDAPILRPVALGELATAQFAPPDYVIDRLIPSSVCSVLGGNGGTGKTMLALVWAAHVAAGVPWAGLAVRKGRVVYVTLEDPAEVVRARLQTIACEYELSLDADALIILDGTDGDAALVREVFSDGGRTFGETAAMSELRAAAEGATLIVVDNASDGFDGDENSRRHVRSFIHCLTRIARDNHCGLLLLVHVDKAAAKNGSYGQSYSGSTAWHNGPRSRMALVEQGTGLELRQEKCNLGRRLDPTAVRFTVHGVLVPHQGTDETKADAELLECIARAIVRGEIVTTSRTGPGNAFSVCKTFPGYPAVLRTSELFYSAVGRLAESGKLVLEKYKNEQRKLRSRWTVAQVAPICASDATGATGVCRRIPCAGNAQGVRGITGARQTGDRDPDTGLPLRTYAPIVTSAPNITIDRSKTHA